MMNEKFLIKSAQKGSEEAWGYLVKKYSGAIYSICYQFTMNSSDAEELMQEVFLKIYYNLNSFDTKKSFLSWAMVLTKNLCIDVYRKNKKEKKFLNSFNESVFKIPSKENIEKEILNKEKYIKLKEYLNELPEETASMILMKDLLGLTLEELSSIFQIPEGTIKSKLARGRLALAVKLKDYFELEEKAK